MAFTPAQAAKVMFYLGYPAATWASTTVTAALTRVTDTSADLETEVAGIITELDTVDAALGTTATTVSGIEVDSTGQVFFEGGRESGLQRRYDQLISRLCCITLLDVYVPRNNRVSFG